MSLSVRVPTCRKSTHHLPVNGGLPQGYYLNHFRSVDGNLEESHSPYVDVDRIENAVHFV